MRLDPPGEVEIPSRVTSPRRWRPPRSIDRMLKGKVDEVKSILARFSFPYSRRIAGEHTHFTRKDYKKWLKEASINQLSLALRRLAQLNQTKVYLFWKNISLNARVFR